MHAASNPAPNTAPTPPAPCPRPPFILPINSGECEGLAPHSRPLRKRSTRPKAHPPPHTLRTDTTSQKPDPNPHPSHETTRRGPA